MRSLRLSLLPVTLVLAATLAVGVAGAATFPPRVPQVPVLTGALQGYLNGVGEAINVNTDQLDAQVWTSSISGNASFTLMLSLGSNGNGNSIGVYNIADPVPTLFQVFPGTAGARWSATAHFGGGGLLVTLFDSGGLFQGQTSYTGVNAQDFGFYVQNTNPILFTPLGTYFTQDGRNPAGAAMALTYAGTGRNFGDWWLCWEDQAAGDRAFDHDVLLLQSVVPTPANGTSWGELKSRYR